MYIDSIFESYQNEILELKKKVKQLQLELAELQAINKTNELYQKTRLDSLKRKELQCTTY